MTAPLTVQASVGSKGTTFLTGSVWLTHLQQGESIGAAQPVTPDGSAEFVAAVNELQTQHHDMTVLLQDWSGGSCCPPCSDDDCIGCAYDRLTEKWEAQR